jgi:hypothetical protein
MTREAAMAAFAFEVADLSDFQLALKLADLDQGLVLDFQQ